MKEDEMDTFVSIPYPGSRGDVSGEIKEVLEGLEEGKVEGGVDGGGAQEGEDLGGVFFIDSCNL